MDSNIWQKYPWVLINKMINIKLMVAIIIEIYISFYNSVPGINSHLKVRAEHLFQ